METLASGVTEVEPSHEGPPGKNWPWQAWATVTPGCKLFARLSAAQTWEEQRQAVCQQRGVSLKGEQTNKGWGGAQCDFGRHLLYPQ